MNVREVMSRPVLTVPPEASLKEVAELMLRHRVSGLPVVNAEGTLMGVVSEGDLLMKEQSAPEGRRWLAAVLGGGRSPSQLAKILATTASEAMTSPPVTVDAGATVRDAAKTMSDRAINRLPVLEAGRLVGIVTRADIVRSFLRSDEAIAEAIREEVLLGTLLVDPSQLSITVTSGVVAISGSVNRRSTAELITRLVGRLEGVVSVKAHISWRVEDRDLVHVPDPRAD